MVKCAKKLFTDSLRTIRGRSDDSEMMDTKDLENYQTVSDNRFSHLEETLTL